MPTDGILKGYLEFSVKNGKRSDLGVDPKQLFNIQEHPTTIFIVKTSFRRSKYCLEFSIFSRIAKIFLDDRFIHVQFANLI